MTLLWIQKDQTISKQLKYVPNKNSIIFIRIEKYPAANKIKCKMNDIQRKIIRHIRKQGNITYNERIINQTDPELTQMLVLTCNDILKVILFVFYIFEMLLSRDIEDSKKSQIKILEMKATMYELEKCTA